MDMRDSLMLSNLTLDNFDKSFKGSNSLVEERKNAFLNLKKIGIPNKRIENWKYMDLAKITKGIEFKPRGINFELLNKNLKGIVVRDFEYFIENKDQYSKLTKYLDNEGVVYLNLSYAQEASVIEIKESQSEPLLINISCNEDGVSFPRIKIDVFPNVEAEVHLVYDGGKGFINQLTEINIQKNSNLRVQRVNKSSAIHSETFLSYLGLNSNISLVNLSMPKNKSRFQVYNIFLDQHSCTDFKSVSIPYEDCQDDFLIQNLHMNSNCESNVGLRAILNKGTVCSFQALVDIDLNTSSSKAIQDCKAILLHEDASMNAKPEMKIFNDDVVCKHGTTIGCLDKEQLFYLQSRGLSAVSAEKILLQGVIKNYISEDSSLNNFLPKVYQ